MINSSPQKVHMMLSISFLIMGLLLLKSVHFIVEEPIIDYITPEQLDFTDTRTQWITITGGNLIDDCFVMIDGVGVDSLYDSETNTIKFKMEYSNWCLKDKINIRVGRKFDINNISKNYAMEVIKKRQDYMLNDLWTQNRFIAHAFGSLDDKLRYTNVLEAFLQNYEKGHRVFEVDLCCTADGIITLRHDWLKIHYSLQEDTFADFEKNNLPKDWEDIKTSSKYTLLTFGDLLNLMREFNDIYVVVDSKNTNSTAVDYMFKQIVATAKDSNSTDALDRMIFEVYNESMFYQIMNIYPFSSVIYAIYHNNATDEQIIDFVDRNNIPAVSCAEDRFNEKLAKGLKEVSCPIYIYTINNESKIRHYASRGAHGFYSDYLGDYNCEIDIDMSNENCNDFDRNYLACKQYLTQLNKGKYIVVFSVKGDASANITNEIMGLFDAFGIDGNSLLRYGHSFVAILDEGKCTKQHCAASKIMIDSWVDWIHIKAQSVGELVADEYSSILIDGKECSKNMKGINIVVYDKNLGQVIDSICFNTSDQYQITN